MKRERVPRNGWSRVARIEAKDLHQDERGNDMVLVRLKSVTGGEGIPHQVDLSFDQEAYKWAVSKEFLYVDHETITGWVDLAAGDYFVNRPVH